MRGILLCAFPRWNGLASSVLTGRGAWFSVRRHSSCGFADWLSVPRHARSLRRPNVGGTWSLLSLSYVEVNAVTLLQMVERTLLHLRMMEEQVSPIRVNEAETAVADNFLDLSLWHKLTPANERGCQLSRLVMTQRADHTE